MLRVENLKVKFDQIQVVRGITFTLRQGMILSVLGESGSGKSVSAMSIMKLYGENQALITADKLSLNEIDLLSINERSMQKIRGVQIAYIFQNPNDALSPNKTIRSQFKELFRVHHRTYDEKEIEALLETVGLNIESKYILNMYPHQLSGGQAQRVTIALALSLNPKVIIADEPTSSIDASLTDVIVELLLSINKKYGISILFITHDFDLAARISDEILILYGGLVMEYGKKTEIFNHAKHPYTQELMKCVNSIQSRDGELYTLTGYALDPTEFKDECPFWYRCMYSTVVCKSQIPQLIEARDTSSCFVRCIHALEVNNE
ncbi:ABC transporter ATP-binding protein [Fusibacter bizertensis]|uniref:ABC transporter ATP-binding protein n=1 Tax=Fusibacter bizertensis TaxID=1488331 RepID=A0ABT6NCX2_9FIRM|nr:ABC transporter ATP-binding protein [Fusibacter bizertensis]MDH8678263.1 ABC transporter ATP-binding protein [Fusibacter bizertensis]